MTYFNTTHETGQTLLNFENKGLRLQDTIYQIFQREQKAMVWSDVQMLIPDANECSLKRSITNLKTEGKLIKTTDKAISKYNKPAYRYKLAG